MSFPMPQSFPRFYDGAASLLDRTMNIEDARIQSGSFRARTQPVDTLVLHYTALDLEASLRVLRYRGVSAHYVLGEDGTAYKILNNDEVAWHAGVSMWRGKKDVNARSIGIEIVNLDGNVHAYPKVQMDALVTLCQKIIAENPRIMPQNVVGHSDVAPKRKVDPGKKFPWKALADNGIGLWPTNTAAAPVGTEAQIQALLERCGYAKPHGYGTKGDGYVFVDNPDAPPAGVSKVVRVGTKDMLRAFQLHYLPNAATGSANGATMGALLSVAAQQP
jgi:N-acetylmuramoyl-L-alanine amidase